MDRTTHPNFVPSDAAGSRKETAVLLVGTAREFGVSQQDIASTHNGFWISDALADVLDAEVEEVQPEEVQPKAEPEPEPKKAQPKPEPKKAQPKKGTTSSKTSGNRAGKNEQE